MIQQERAQQTAAVIELWHRWSTEEQFQQQVEQQHIEEEVTQG
jgi:hypothetical protein